MSGRYSSLPNPLAQDAEHELDAAFESDDDDDNDDHQLPGESTPLNPHNTSTDVIDDPLTRAQASHGDHLDNPASRTIPGGYDFEADPFDYAAPPPGSPPGPSSFAHPNQWGNSNGILPAEPVIPKHSSRRGGIFRRAVGALLPTHYQRLDTDEGVQAGPARGSGLNNDGVFANLTAKPGRGRIVQDGESIHVVPEDVQKEAPPSYAVAQADSAPAYYETIVHTQSSGLDGEVLVDAMPTGSIFTFAWTMLISLSFQFVGFLLTYLLHTTHAAKFGSRAGLGITIIQYAFFLRRRALKASEQYDEYQPWWDSTNPNLDGELTTSPPEYNATVPEVPTTTYPVSYFSGTTTEWLSFVLMSLGWFVLLTSLLGFWRVKRWERGIRQASEPVQVASSQELQRDRDIGSSLSRVFGIPMEGQEEDEFPELARGPNGEPPSEEEIRLARDLRASGLL